LAEARRRAAEILDAPGSDRSTIIDVEPARGTTGLARSARGALTTFVQQRLPFLALPQDGPETKPFPLAKVTFTAFVLVPAITIVLYFAFLASNQYIAEMRLVVRVGRVGNAGGISGIVSQIAGGVTGMPGGGGGGMSMSTDSGTSTENAHIVTSYIGSRAIVDEVGKTLNLKEIFRRPEADFYARLPENASAEDLVDYWQAMVSASLEPMSGIVTVRVRAFRPDDAVAISNQIEALSEKLVNEISVRARADALRRATQEVERAQGVLLASLRELEKFRNREGLIDPIEAAKETGKLLAKVLAEQLEAENQLFIASKSLAPDSASVRTLTTRAGNLRRQAAELRAQLAGNDGQASNIAGTLARYEEVAVQQKLAQTLYTMAENGLERARIAAEAQSVYLSVFVKPGVPEDSTYPKRIEFSILLVGLFLMAWSIAALIWASVQDHRLG
jgi:capsular polysaccharide transport system permease protein